MIRQYKKINSPTPFMVFIIFFLIILPFGVSAAETTLVGKQIAMIIDEIQCFWLDKKDILSFELENLTSEKKCFLLSGATYLDVKDNEHYIFKALGDEHIISDPLLKLEPFFRVSNQVFDRGVIEVFRRAYSDVLNILSNFQNIFYILPIHQIANSDKREYMELLRDFFFKIC